MKSNVREHTRMINGKKVTIHQHDRSNAEGQGNSNSFNKNKDFPHPEERTKIVALVNRVKELDGEFDEVTGTQKYIESRDDGKQVLLQPLRKKFSDIEDDFSRLGLYTFSGNINWRQDILPFYKNSNQFQMVDLSPNDFLRLSTELQGINFNSILDIYDRIYQGQPLSTPFFEMTDKDRNIITNHEGRHRAILLRKMGVKEMPVAIVGGSYVKFGVHSTKKQNT